MTIEELARLTQEEFAAVHKETLDLRTEMRDELVSLRREMHGGFDALTTVLVSIKDDLKEIRRNTAETQVELVDLRRRVARLEEKAGFKD